MYVRAEGTEWDREISGTWATGTEIPNAQTAKWYLQTPSNVVWLRTAAGYVRHVDPLTLYPAREQSVVIGGETYASSANLDNRDLTNSPWKDATWFHYWPEDDDLGVTYRRLTTDASWVRYDVAVNRYGAGGAYACLLYTSPSPRD